MVRATELLAALDEALRGLAWDDLMRALPGLRLAFTWFPPRERDAIARHVLALHGEVDLSASRLRELDEDVDVWKRAAELEAALDAAEARYGLAR